MSLEYETAGSHGGEYEDDSLLRRVVSKYTDVSEVRTASVCIIQLDHTALYSRSLPS
jgi:hypothetical protein